MLTFHEYIEKLEQEQLDEVNWKSVVGAGAAALGGMFSTGGQAADYNKMTAKDVQQIALKAPLDDTGAKKLYEKLVQAGNTKAAEAAKGYYQRAAKAPKGTGPAYKPPSSSSSSVTQTLDPHADDGRQKIIEPVDKQMPPEKVTEPVLRDLGIKIVRPQSGKAFTKGYFDVTDMQKAVAKLKEISKGQGEIFYDPDQNLIVWHVEPGYQKKYTYNMGGKLTPKLY